MANKQRIDINLAFSADTTLAKRQVQDLQATLNKLSQTTIIDFNGPEQDIKEAVASVNSLKTALQQATDVDTGKLNLNKFNEALDRSGYDLKTYRSYLLSLGETGEKAFFQLSNAILGAEVPLKRTSQWVDKLFVTFNNNLRWMVTSNILNTITGTFQSAFYYAKDLNESLNNIRIVTGKNINEMKDFADEATRAAKALSTTTVDYTDAALIYFQQGLSDKEVVERTNATIKLANVTGETVTEVSDQLTAVWNNFSEDGTKSLEYYVDVMTALGAATASSTDEISQGLSKFAAIADTVGLSYEYATAALATVTSATRQSADIVGTAFKTIFARMQDLELGNTLEDGTTLGSYSEALLQVGINIKDSNGALRDMDNILDEMGAKWQTLSKDQQVALAQAVGGVRQYNQVVSLMDNWDFMQENLKTAYSAEGTLQKQQDIYADSWEAAADRVTAAAEDIYNSLINDELIIDLLDGFGGFLNLLDSIVEGLGGMRGLLTVIVPLATSLFSKQLSTSMGNLAENILSTTSIGRNFIIGQKKQAVLDDRELLENQAGDFRADNTKEAKIRFADLQLTFLEKANQWDEQQLLEQQNLLDNNRTLLIQLDKATDQVIYQKEQLDTLISKIKDKNPSILTDLEIDQAVNNYQDFRQIETLLKDPQKNQARLKDLINGVSSGKIDFKDNKFFEGIFNAINNEDYTNVSSLILDLQVLEEEMTSAVTQSLINAGDNQEAKQLYNQIQLIGAAIEEMGNAQTRVKHKLDEMAVAQKKPIQRYASLTNQITLCSNALLSLASVAGIVGNAINVLTDETATSEEKITTVISSIAAGVPVLLNTITQLSKVTSLISAARKFQAAGSTIKAASALGYTAGTLKNTIKILSVLKQYALPLGVIITAITAIAGLVDKSIESLEEAKQKTDETTKAYKEQKSELDNIEQEISDITEKIKELESLGTLSVTEEKELERLKSENSLLAARKTLLEENAKSAKAAQIQAILNETSHKPLHTLDSDWISRDLRKYLNAQSDVRYYEQVAEDESKQENYEAAEEARKTAESKKEKVPELTEELQEELNRFLNNFEILYEDFYSDNPTITPEQMFANAQKYREVQTKLYGNEAYQNAAFSAIIGSQDDIVKEQLYKGQISAQNVATDIQAQGLTIDEFNTYIEEVQSNVQRLGLNIEDLTGKEIEYINSNFDTLRDKSKKEIFKIVHNLEDLASYDISGLEIDEATFKTYVEQLRKVFDESVLTEQQLYDLAVAYARLDEGVTNLNEDWDENYSILSDLNNKSLPEYAEALTQVQQTLKTIYNIPIDSSFFDDIANVELVNKLVAGTPEEAKQAYYEIGEVLTLQIAAGIDNPNALAELQLALDKVDLSGLAVGEVLEAEGPLVSAINHLLINAGTEGVLLAQRIGRALGLNLALSAIESTEEGVEEGTIDHYELKSATFLGGYNDGVVRPSSAKEATDRKKEIDYYYEVNERLEDIQQQYDRISEARSRAWGDAALGYIDQEIASTQNLIAAQQDYLKIARERAAITRGEAANQGFTFDASGRINNYGTRLESLIGNGDAFDAAQEAADAYTESLNNAENALIEIENLEYQIADLQLEKITKAIEFDIQLNESDLERLEYEIGKLDDTTFSLAKTLSLMSSSADKYQEQIEFYEDGIEEIIDLANEQGTLTSAQVDTLEEYRSALISANEELLEINNTMREALLNALKEVNEQLDESIDRFETYNKVLENYKEIIELSGGNADRNLLTIISGAQVENAMAQLKVAKERYDTMLGAQEEANEKLREAWAAGDKDAIELWKQNLEDATIEAEKAFEGLTASWNEALQSAADNFKAMADEIATTLESALSGIERLDTLDKFSDALDKGHEIEEQYLDTTEQVYEINKLNREVEKSLNSMNNLAGKAKLQDFLEEIQRVENERYDVEEDRVKMSQYDLDLLNAKYQLTLAQIALEESQNAKNNMRLVRDAQGNWNYAFVGDEQAISDAEQNVADKEMELYNLSDNYVTDLSDQIVQNEQQITNLIRDFDPEKDNIQDLEDKIAFYLEKDAYLRGEMQKGLDALGLNYDDTIFGALEDLGSLQNGHQNLVLNTQNSLGQMRDEWNNWQENIQEATEIAGKDFDNLTDNIDADIDQIINDTDDLTSQLENEVYPTIEDFVDDVIDEIDLWADSWNDGILAMIHNLEDYIDQIDQTVKAVDRLNTAQGSSNSGSSSSGSSASGEDESSKKPYNPSTGVHGRVAEYTARVGVGDLYFTHTASSKELAAKALMNKIKREVYDGYIPPELKKTLEKKITYIKHYGAFDTGGYTGEWGQSGKLAVLHEKELVLNKSDTSNILSAVQLLRAMTGQIGDYIKTNASMPTLLHSYRFKDIMQGQTQALEQKVEVYADFPGVHSAVEIEMALRDIANDAAQYASIDK